MNKIKILHLIATLRLGGAEAHLFSLVKALNTSLFDIHVGYSFGGEFERKFNNQRIKLYKYAKRWHKVKSLMSIVVIIRIAIYIYKNKIDIVHTHTYSDHVWGSIAAKLLRIKVIEHVHDPRYEEPYFLEKTAGNPKQFKHSKYFARLSDIIIVLTNSNRNYLLNHHICSDHRIKVFYNGIDLDIGMYDHKIIENMKQEYGISKYNKVIISVGRIAIEKNYKLIIELAKQMKEVEKDIVFLIIGDGPLRSQLLEEVKNNRLEDKVKIIGFCLEIKAFLSFADIYIHPSIRELHSISIIEAMSMGVPVIVSKKVGNNSDIITPGLNGYLLDPNNAKEWMDTINMLLNDETLSAYIARNGRKLVEDKCNIKINAKYYESLYVQLAGKE